MAEGKRPPRRHRPGHQGLPADGARPQRPPAVRLPHPPRLRGEPAATPDRSHRPVPDAPRRSSYAVGRDLAGDGALVPAGKITYVGSSNFAGWDIALAQSAASARHFVGLTSEQSLYNLATEPWSRNSFPRFGTWASADPVQPSARRAARGSRCGGSDDPRVEAHRQQLVAYEGLCRDLGAQPAAVALAWLLRTPSWPRPSSEP